MKKVMVAMSGGVDSSLTAALLLERGFEVSGVTMLLESGNVRERSCCSSKEVEDAAAVAQKLGIKFHVVKKCRELFRGRISSRSHAKSLRSLQSGD